MATDFALRDFIEAEVERVVRRRLGGLQAPVGAQKEGVPTSDGHRTINFTGLGVTVTDNPSQRRVDVSIPGGLAANSRFTGVVSTAGQGSVLVSASTPPNDGAGKNWTQVGYSLTGWSATIANTFAYPAGTAPPGATMVCPVDGTVSATQVFYLHHEFTLATGQTSDGILDYILDATGPVYVNGTLVASDTSTVADSYFSATIPAGLLVVGTNCIAIQVTNQAGSTPNPSSVGYRVTTSTPAAGGAAVLSANLGANTALATTPTTLLTLTLTPGTWVVFAECTILQGTSNSTSAIEITDGTNHYGSASVSVSASFIESLGVISEPITVSSGSLNVSLVGETQSGAISATAQASTGVGAFAKATHMRAIRTG